MPTVLISFFGMMFLMNVIFFAEEVYYPSNTIMTHMCRELLFLVAGGLCLYQVVEAAVKLFH